MKAGLVIAWVLLFACTGTANKKIAVEVVGDKDQMFSVKSVDVQFRSEGIVLEGTFTVPEDTPSNVPAVILIHGSGPNTRDQGMAGQLNMGFGFEIPVFKELAHGLSQRGIAVLRYDKRSCSKRSACGRNAYPDLPLEKLGMSAFLHDVKAAVSYLRSRGDIDGTNIFLVGHSQGGSLVPLALKDDLNLAGGIVLATPASTIDEVLEEQLELSRKLVLATGASEVQADVALAGLNKIVAGVQAIKRNKTMDGSVGGAPAQVWREWLDFGARAFDAAASLRSRLWAVGGDFDWNVASSELERWKSVLGEGRTVGLECITHALNCVSQTDLAKLRPEDIGRSVEKKVVQSLAEIVLNHGSESVHIGQ